MALGVVPGGKLAHMFAKSGLGSFIGKIGSSAWSSAKHYAGKAGSALGKGARGLVDRAGQFLRKSCGCFESGTVVWTLRGHVPIEQVTADDFVFAQDETTGEFSIRKVLRTFVRQGAPIIAVTITTAAGASETLRTTEEHPFWVPAIGWVEAGSLTRGDAVEVPGGCATVESVRFTPDLEAVYNFEVEGVHTYFVGANGVLVHNRGPCKLKVLGGKIPRSELKYRPSYRGGAPYGLDGKGIELHHPNAQKPLEVREMGRDSHRGKGNKKQNHPEPWEGMSAGDRSAYDAERRLYWEQEWDSGRFEGLPSKPR